MDKRAEQKRAYLALLLMATAMVVYDIPAMLPTDRVVSNTVDGDFQTVVMDLTKLDPWAVHAWVRQLCYGLLCTSIMVIGWRNIAARAIGITGAFWYLGQAVDAYVAGNLFDDGLWEYALLTGGLALCATLIYQYGWKR